MKIQILGSGCKKCNDLMTNVKTVIQENAIDCELEKVTDIEKIVNMGALVTPALAVDGKVVSYGKVLSPEEILPLIKPDTGSCCCCCCGNKEETAKKEEKTANTPCCCSSQKNPFFKKVLAALLLVFVFGSVLYMIDRETKATPQKQGTKQENNLLKVYYFHGSQRCFTCNKIEELTQKAVSSAENVRFIPVNVEEKVNEHFIQDFQLSTRCVVMERNGKFEKFEKVWELVRTPEKFHSYIREGMERNSK